MNKVLFSSEKEDWETPEWLFEELDNEFNFTLDPCCSLENRKCKKYYTKEEDGLKQDWGGNHVFVNPPYGRKSTAEWIEKCYNEAQKKDTIVVLLIPARTDTKAFHEFIYNKAEIRFIKGRLKFGNSLNSAPFPSMICIFKSEK